MSNMQLLYDYIDDHFKSKMTHHYYNLTDLKHRFIKWSCNVNVIHEWCMSLCVLWRRVIICSLRCRSKANSFNQRSYRALSEPSAFRVRRWEIKTLWLIEKSSAHVGVITPFRTHSEEKIKKRSLFSLWSLYNEHWLIVAASNWNSFRSHFSRLDQ